MHEELSDAGERTIRNGTIMWFVLLMAISAWISLSATVTHGATAIVTGLVVGAAVGAAAALRLLLRNEGHAVKKSFPKAQSQYDPYLTWRAEKFAIALGVPPPAVYQFFSEAPNVAAFPWADGTALMVSSAAQYGLTEQRTRCPDGVAVEPALCTVYAGWLRTTAPR